MTRMRPFSIVCSTIALLGTLSVIPPSLSDEEWMQVRSGKAYGISGMAWIDRHGDTPNLAIVHDNKTEDLDRLAIVSLPPHEQPQYYPIPWSDDTEFPVDLEGLVAVPDDSFRFMALESQGRVFDFRLDPDRRTIETIQTFDLPDIPDNSNFEGFALTRIRDQLIAVWAHRGEGEDPGVLYWGEFNLDRGEIGLRGRQEVRVPQPPGNPRHISDIKIDRAGRVWISSATDPGDDGPFDSAIYTIGRFEVKDETIALDPFPSLTPIAAYEGHKIEAIEILPDDRSIIGTDDENAGGFIRIDRLATRN
ncbi:MAG TPA: hypothetical protein IGS17_13260 [Oscillatoriales cyanobacterium M59_W2019_021]|nr:hypothetical protein [Oscillatoriales cyanobacterium M4454_W2019_049]HIK51873.1 hypothetical protein [Oscillatoriales cyanobacterium M59_W2019_021]